MKDFIVAYCWIDENDCCWRAQTENGQLFGATNFNDLRVLVLKRFDVTVFFKMATVFCYEEAISEVGDIPGIVL